MLAELEATRAELGRLRAIVDTPELDDFLRGVSIEAEHARKRWKKDDVIKSPFEWFGLVLYLAGKMARAFRKRLRKARKLK